MLDHTSEFSGGSFYATSASSSEGIHWPTFSRIATLIVSDLLALAAAALLGFYGWAHLVLHQSVWSYVALAPLLPLFPAAYAAAGLYPGFGLGAVETLRRLVHCTNASFVAIAAGTFVFKADPFYSRMTFALMWTAALILVPFVRFIARLIVKQLRWWGDPVIIFGSSGDALKVIQSLRHAFALGYQVSGVVLSDSSEAPLNIENIPVLGGTEALEVLANTRINTVLLWDGFDDPSSVDLLHRHFANVVLIRDGHSLPIEHVQLRNLGGVLGIEFKSDLLNRPNAIIKRAMDLIVGTVLLILSAPFIVLFGLLIKVLSPGGPIFFSQEREGLRGIRFRVWKLRTMYPNAEELLEPHLASDPQLRQQWEESVKLINDPRVIPVIGGFMRLLSIDELPQFWNIVCGTMSLVGPRPFPEYHLERFRLEFRRFRSAVRPGLTGMWQVMVRSDGDLDDQERFDSYYIRNWSLWLDAYIIARTFFAVLGRKGAR